MFKMPSISIDTCINPPSEINTSHSQWYLSIRKEFPDPCSYNIISSSKCEEYVLKFVPYLFVTLCIRIHIVYTVCICHFYSQTFLFVYVYKYFKTILLESRMKKIWIGRMHKIRVPWEVDTEILAVNDTCRVSGCNIYPWRQLSAGPTRYTWQSTSPDHILNHH